MDPNSTMGQQMQRDIEETARLRSLNGIREDVFDNPFFPNPGLAIPRDSHPSLTVHAAIEASPELKASEVVDPEEPAVIETTEEEEHAEG